MKCSLSHLLFAMAWPIPVYLWAKFVEMKLIFWAIVIWLAWTFYFHPRLNAGQQDPNDRIRRSNTSREEDEYIDIDYEEVDDESER